MTDGFRVEYRRLITGEESFVNATHDALAPFRLMNLQFPLGRTEVWAAIENTSSSA